MAFLEWIRGLFHGAQGEHYWVTVREGSRFPAKAFFAGHDTDGARIYVGRAVHESDVLPAKVVPSRNICYVSYEEREHEKLEYEVLCGNGLEWIQASDGQVPPGSVKGGNTSYGEPLFIGRVSHMGSNCVGKVHPSQQVCFIPYNGLEHSYRSYEILVQKY